MPTSRRSAWTTLLLPLLLAPCACDRMGDRAEEITNEVIETTKWELVTLRFEGPETSETAADNPFTNYRLTVDFVHEDGMTLRVPGYYAADGDAAETGADAGAMWEAKFRPPLAGTWTYLAEMLQGENAAVTEAEPAGIVTKIRGGRGTIEVGPAAAGERGRLERTHPRYLNWAETGDYFLKGAADSPENLLGYFEFDSTYRHRNEFREGENRTEGLHEFADHAGDFRSGPTWRGGKGKNIMGAIQYLHDQGANGFYALTMNINGDGKDVWPYVDHATYDRFDISKLAQWERVFQFADDLGMMIHLVLQETENETLLDGGDTGPLRKLYFREMIARFGHHRALTWNLGEENGPNNWSDTHQTTAQQRAMIAYLGEHDPWRNHLVLHTHPGEEAFAEIYRPLLGNDTLTGLSIQLGDPYRAHAVTAKWLRLSREAGAPWILTLDEVGPWWRGLDPDAGFTANDGASNNQDSLRALTLWGNLMAGGAGVEWYFGAKNAENDLSAETYRTRERAWNWTGHGLDFFRNHLPFYEMEMMDELVSGEAMCFTKAGEVYAVYLPFGEATSLDLSAADGTFTLSWYNPREGGELIRPEQLTGGSSVTLTPPGPGDWAALIR